MSRTRIWRAGGAIAVAAFVTLGILANTGQYVPGSGGSVSGAAVIDNQYSSKHLEWIDEMIYQNIVQSAGAGNAGFWSLNTSGTQSVAPIAAAGRPGLLEISVTTATTGRFGMQWSNSMVDFNSASWTFETTVGFPTLSTAADEYTALVGFADVSSSRDQTDGCYFLYDRGNAATGGTNSSNLNKFSCWCVSNSTRTTFLMDGSTVSNESFTTVDAPVAAYTAPSTNIYSLKVAMTGTTRAEFFVNGVKSCNINTNIPSGATRATGVLAFMIRGAATAARTMDVDRVRVAADLNSARSP